MKKKVGLIIFFIFLVILVIYLVNKKKIIEGQSAQSDREGGATLVSLGSGFTVAGGLALSPVAVLVGLAMVAGGGFLLHRANAPPPKPKPPKPPKKK
jgi:hypothetical protein